MKNSVFEKYPKNRDFDPFVGSYLRRPYLGYPFWTPFWAVSKPVAIKKGSKSVLKMWSFWGTPKTGHFGVPQNHWFWTLFGPLFEHLLTLPNHYHYIKASSLMLMTTTPHSGQIPAQKGVQNDPKKGGFWPLFDRFSSLWLSKRGQKPVILMLMGWTPSRWHRPTVASTA